MEKPNDGLKVLVGIPAYNEELYISGVVLLARQFADEVIVIDDGSTDQTSQIAELAGATVVKHPKNLGYGVTIQAIFREAAKRQPEVLITLDGDNQHDANDIPKLVEAIRNGADVVIGSRSAQKHRIPAYRRFGQSIIARLTNLASRTKLSDTESGFRAYSQKAIVNLKLKQKGMAISAEIIHRASVLGLIFAEAPISISYNSDSSTFNPVIHGISVVRQVIFMITDRRPLLIFGISSLFCLALALLFGIQAMLMYFANKVAPTGYTFLAAMFIILGALLISTGFILSALARRR